MSMSVKILLALVALAGAGIAGFETARRTIEPQIIVKTETETVYKDRIKVQTKTVSVKETKPDGTIKETTTTETKSDTKSSAKAEDKPAVVEARRDYSAGVVWRPDWRDPAWQPAGVTAGYRVIGNFWIDATVTLDREPSALVGVRVEW